MKEMPKMPIVRMWSNAHQCSSQKLRCSLCEISALVGYGVEDNI